MHASLRKHTRRQFDVLTVVHDGNEAIAVFIVTELLNSCTGLMTATANVTPFVNTSCDAIKAYRGQQR